MPDPSTIATNLRQTIQELAQMNPEDVCTRATLPPSFNFAPLLDAVSNLRDVALRYRSLAIESLPSYVVGLINGLFVNVAIPIREMRDFTIDERVQQIPERHRDLTKRAQNTIQDVLPKLVVNYPVAVAYVPGVDELARSTLARLEADAEKAAESAKLAERLAEETKQAAAKVGIAKHAAVFADAARQHRTAAHLWLGGTLLLVGLTLAGAYRLFNGLSASGSFDAAAIQHIILRVALLSLGYFLVVMAARNYRANRHLQVVNEHRSNALQTFQIFAEQAHEDPVRDAVLLEATRCIFGQAVTGYLGPDEQIQMPASDAVRSLISRQE